MPLRPTTRRLRFMLSILAFAIVPAFAIDEPLRALRAPTLGVETGPQPDIDLEAPPSAYPLKPVEQIAFRGARHGLVNTTTGTLAFQTLDLRLPGRMPIEMTRVFDTAISLFMPPPPPLQQNEPRWTYDLGKNWILGYAAYLVPISGGVLQATPEGDLIWFLRVGYGTAGCGRNEEETLEKHLGRIVLACLVAVGTGCTSQDARVVRASEFAVVDPQGVVVARLRALPKGGGALGLLNNRGELRISLQSDELGAPALHLLDRKGNPRLQLGLEDMNELDLPYVSLRDMSGTVRVAVVVQRDGGALVSVLTPQGKPAARVAVDASGNGSVTESRGREGAGQ